MTELVMTDPHAYDGYALSAPLPQEAQLGPLL